jgi:two-component system, NarL family, sensor kinase
LIGIILVLNRSRYKRQQELLIKEKEISVHEAYILASIQSQENERKRFAQDLHDGMGQLISALRLSLLSVNRDSSLEHRVTIVNKAEGLLNDMHREIRSIAFNLMPQTLVQHGLVPALKEMAERITSSGQILIRVSSFDVPERFTEVVEISLYRAIQEWINNVVKYSRARIIEVQLVGHDQEIAITIEDNGDGFDPSVLENSKGNGWKNIKSRLNLIKGAVDIDSLPERKSTTLILRVPVAKMKSSNAERSTANQINQ